jgi:hypothetical protein
MAAIQKKKNSPIGSVNFDGSVTIFHLLRHTSVK